MRERAVGVAGGVGGDADVVVERVALEGDVGAGERLAAAALDDAPEDAAAARQREVGFGAAVADVDRRSGARANPRAAADTA